MMGFPEERLDVVLVGAGFAIMCIYHTFLFYRYCKQSHTTMMGVENNHKKEWVYQILQADRSSIPSAVAVVSANISASNYLATISLTLCALIGAWIANTRSVFLSSMILGDTGENTLFLKYICLLFFFLLAFTFFVQAVRGFVHVIYLITIPANNSPEALAYVEDAVISAGEFWSLGLRSLYFALNFLLWFFGPIPMFMSSIIMVGFLHFLDRNTRKHSVFSNQRSNQSRQATS